MRRLYAPVLIALVVLSLYGLAFAETEPGPDKKPDLLPNAGFEEAVPIPSKSRAYPVGWYTSFSRGTEIVWEIGEESGNAVRIIGKNPNAIYTKIGRASCRERV